jgi:undecaprenyl-diphosphatase
MKGRELILAGLVSLALFILNTAVVETNAAQSGDAHLAVLINNYYLGAALNELMVLASQHGRELFWGLAVLVLVLLGKRETRLLGIELGILFVIGIVTGDALKAFLPLRQRPYQTLSNIIARFGTDMDSSYPSGHALIVSIGAAFSLLKFSRKWVAGLLTLEAAVVCYSRIYLGLHYFSDVVGGVLAGCTIVFLGTFLLEKYAVELGRMADYVLGKLLGEGWLKA